MATGASHTLCGPAGLLTDPHLQPYPEPLDPDTQHSMLYSQAELTLNPKRLDLVGVKNMEGPVEAASVIRDTLRFILPLITHIS